jgi:3-hydroxyisobutyrate dehydrogenase
MSRIAFLGLGMMGFPMAHLLHAAGHQLLVSDANPTVQEKFLAVHPGTQAVGDVTAYADCDVIITMLPNSDIVDSVLHELALQAKQGACVIEMSSADPLRTRNLSTFLLEKGISLIDAPVSGGVKKAVNGTLAIMVGGDLADFERQKPILDVLGKAVTHVGTVGSGHALKALNNYVSAAALIATAEAIHIGTAFGIKPATIVDVINASTGKNNTTENKAHQFMLNGAFNSGFSLALQAKDVGIAAALGHSMNLPTDLGQKVYAITATASQTLGPTADHTELFKFVGIDPTH